MTKIKDFAITHGVPIVKDGTLALIKDTIIKNGYKNILELGSAIGYSAIEMAKIDPLIHIDTIEKDDRRYALAVENIKEAGLDDQISIYHMAIEDFKIWHDYDLIFIDAAKAHNREYLEMCFPHLVPWGVMIFDNMSFHGFVKDNKMTHNRHTLSLVKKIQSFIDSIQEDERFDIILDEDIGDGILQVRRKSL